MELFGCEYVIDFVISALKQENRRKILEVYITDGIKLISDILHGIYGGGQFNLRYLDIVEPKEEKRTAEEIISHIKSLLQGGEEDEPV